MAKLYTFALFALAAMISPLHAAIPVRWSTDAFKVKPLDYECYHGETLDLSSYMTAYGEPLDFAGKTARLYWQTNGMASAWWYTNATVRSENGATNILAAVFSGAFDTGADSVTGFIGIEGENYRAGFTLRFRASPGFVPNTLPLPTAFIDCAKVTFLNPDRAPWSGGGGGGSVSPSQVTNIANYRIDDKVAAWALKPNEKPSGDLTPATNYTDYACANTYTAAVTAAEAMLSETNSAFSNAVMSVGIGIGTNDVAQINAILTEMGEPPIGAVTTIGSLLAALAAAVAWLKRKVSTHCSVASMGNGVWQLSDTQTDTSTQNY